MTFVGTAFLTRFVVRRERVRAIAWVVSIGVLVVLSAASVKGLFPTQHDLDLAAATEQSAAAIIFNGPPLALDTIGGQVSFQLSTFELIIVGLMSSLMIGRLVRGEEESGRLELLRSLPVGPHAPTAAALAVVGGMDLTVGAVTTLGLVSLGLPAEGSMLLGAAVALTGLAFAAVAMVTSQITENTRAVHGVTGVILGVAFLFRAVGDVGDGTWSWLSPIGWAQKARPFAGERWWPLLLLVLLSASAAVLAAHLSGRRDLGGALIRPRPGPAVALPRLGHPLGLAWRLHRGSVFGWATGVFTMGIAFGSIGDTVDQYVRDNEAMAKIFAAAGGGNLTDAYFGTTASFIALLVASYATSAALRPRSEELALRLEPLVATRLSRRSWLLSHTAAGGIGTVVVTASGGLGTCLGYALVTGLWSKAMATGLGVFVFLPAAWILAGLALACYGARPELTLFSWLPLAGCWVVAFLGQLLDLPRWLQGLSPIERTPHLPAESFDWPAVGVITAGALLLVTLAVIALDRRDLGRLS